MRIGTCSWKYESWRGLVYPEFGDINYLEEYSKVYNTVEIDQWFWSLNKHNAVLPKPFVVEGYNDVTPSDFKFSIKVPNSLTLTHYYKSQIINPFFLSHDLMEAFIDSLRPLHEKIGLLMFQFEYLNKQKMKSLSEFISKINKFISSYKHGIKIGIETRNPNYLTDEYFSFLKENRITPVFLQGYYMPSIIEIYQKFESYINEQIVIRLHGYDRERIEERTKKIWDQIVEPKDDELVEIINVVRDLKSKDIEIFMNVNNHYEGSAPLTIKKIKEFL